MESGDEVKARLRRCRHFGRVVGERIAAVQRNFCRADRKITAEANVEHGHAQQGVVVQPGPGGSHDATHTIASNRSGVDERIHPVLLRQRARPEVTLAASRRGYPDPSLKWTRRPSTWRGFSGLCPHVAYHGKVGIVPNELCRLARRRRCRRPNQSELLTAPPGPRDRRRRRAGRGRDRDAGLPLRAGQGRADGVDQPR